MKILNCCIFLFFIFQFHTIYSCTIFCGKDNHGHVWAGNNEDGAYSFNNYINVFPKTEDTKYGYFTLSFDSAKNGENGGVEGGMNEAGLFYDFNALATTEIKGLYKKKSFPGGDFKILSHILANMSTVKEVVDFFDVYWFDVGFNSAQMHVADKYGDYAIIGPSGIRIAHNENFQISTNFDICGNQDHSDTSRYWRYPIVKEALDKKEIGLKHFIDICERTSIKGKGFYSNYTIYSNIQNLNTGEVWFFFTSDYKKPYKTSIQELISKGRKSYLIRDLFKQHPITKLYDTFTKDGGYAAFEEFKILDITSERKDEIASIFATTIFANDYAIETVPFLNEYLKSEPVGHWMRSAKAIVHYQNGDIEKAKSIIQAYKEEVPDTSMDVEQLLNLFDGRFIKEANTTIELNGFQNAKRVYVQGLPVAFNFLIKKDGKWVGKYHLDPGIYNYIFLVDGEEILDTKTPIKTTASKYEDWYISHQLNIGMSNDAYRTTIRVKTQNINDIVYIAGNQKNLTNWDPVFRLKKISDYEREITLNLHYPAEFKFVNSVIGDSEAILVNSVKDKDENILPIVIDLKSTNDIFEIINWKINDK